MSSVPQNYEPIQVIQEPLGRVPYYPFVAAQAVTWPIQRDPPPIQSHSRISTSVHHSVQESSANLVGDHAITWSTKPWISSTILDASSSGPLVDMQEMMQQMQQRMTSYEQVSGALNSLINSKMLMFAF